MFSKRAKCSDQIHPDKSRLHGLESIFSARISVFSVLKAPAPLETVGETGDFGRSSVDIRSVKSQVRRQGAQQKRVSNFV